MENKEIKFKKGDWVKMQITQVRSHALEFPIRCGSLSFTYDGRYELDSPEPTIFPLDEPEFKERWMMVSNNEKEWYKRKVFAFKEGGYVAWRQAETEEEVKKCFDAIYWQYAKEIEEEEHAPLTIEERLQLLEQELIKLKSSSVDIKRNM